MQTSSGHENTMTSSLGSFEGRGLTFQGLLYLLICILFLVNSPNPEKPGDLKEAYNICDIETRVSLTMAAKNGMSEQEDKACSPCMGKKHLKGSHCTVWCSCYLLYVTDVSKRRAARV